MIAISVNDLSLEIGTTPILTKVSFALEENDKLGIIGVNGCGKSTLLRLITGEAEPSEGEVYLSKGKTVGILTQDGAFVADDPTQTVLERMYGAFPKLLSAEARLAELEAALGSGEERINDTAESVTALRDIAAAHPCVDGVELLPFRKMCRLKYDEMGVAFPFAHLPEPTAEEINALKAYLK